MHEILTLFWPKCISMIINLIDFLFSSTSGVLLDSKLPGTRHITHSKSSFLCMQHPEIPIPVKLRRWSSFSPSILQIFRPEYHGLRLVPIRQRSWNYPSPSGTGAKSHHQTGTWSHKNYSQTRTPSWKQNPTPLIQKKQSRTSAHPQSYITFEHRHYSSLSTRLGGSLGNTFFSRNYSMKPILSCCTYM